MSFVKCAVFPVAGLGTRFLPATKAVAKELLPVVDRPLIQYAVAECEAAGIERIILVTSRLKNSLIDHFEQDENLERSLRESGKKKQLDLVRNVLPADIQLFNVRQSQLRGLGHAVLCAKDLVGDEPFAVVLPDDLLVPDSGGVSPALKDMVECYDRLGQSVVAVEEVAPQQISDYGIVDSAEEVEEGKFRVRGLVEKPSVEDAPSRLGVVGRYVLTAEVFVHLQRAASAAQAANDPNELQLTDAIHCLAPEVIAYRLRCKRYDCGSKLGFLRANLAAAAKDPELQGELLQFASTLVGEQPGAD